MAYGICVGYNLSPDAKTLVSRLYVMYPCRDGAVDRQPLIFEIWSIPLSQNDGSEDNPKQLESIDSGDQPMHSDLLWLYRRME